MASAIYAEPGSDATQDLTLFSSSGGTVASATDQSFTGPRSLKLSTGSPATLAFLATRVGVLADAGRAVQFRFRTDTLPAADGGIIVLSQSGGSTIFTLTLRTSGVLQLTPNGATAVNGTTVLAVNTWYLLTIAYTITNSTTFRFTLFINGASEASATAGTLSFTTSSNFALVNTTSAGANVNNWFDDIYVDDRSDYTWPGNVRCTNKRPNANGTKNEFTTQIGAGGSGYGSGHSPQVNEQPLSTTNGWSDVNAGSVHTEEYNVEGLGTGDVALNSSDTIVGVLGWVDCKALVGENGNIIVNGESIGINIPNAANGIVRAASSTSYPAGTGADIGLATDTTVTTISLYECGIIIAYIPRLVPSVSDTATFSETQTLAVPLPPNVSDTVTFSEVVTDRITVEASVSDTITAAELQAIALDFYNPLLTDSVTFTELVLLIPQAPITAKRVKDVIQSSMVVPYVR